MLTQVIPTMLVFYFRRLNVLLDVRKFYHGALAAMLICMLFIRARPYFPVPVCLAVFSLAGVLGTYDRLAAGRRIKSPHATIMESTS